MRLKLSFLAACAFMSSHVAFAQSMVTTEPDPNAPMPPFTHVPKDLAPGQGVPAAVPPKAVKPLVVEKPKVEKPKIAAVAKPAAPVVAAVVPVASKKVSTASSTSKPTTSSPAKAAAPQMAATSMAVSADLAAKVAEGWSKKVQVIDGMPPVVDPQNIYSEASGPDKMSPVVAHDLVRIYVPNLRGDSVSVIDPATMKVVNTFPVGHSPQHVVPSWDLRTLWVTNNSEGRTDGSLTPIDPLTGKPGAPVTVDDPYNMYFTPDGKEAIVVAEAKKRLDFRNPHTMGLNISVDVPLCKGINHAAFSADGRYALFTCEFGGYMAKIDTVNHKVLGMLKLSKGGMPQDVLAAPNGHKFYVADMWADGVFIIDGDNLKETGFIPTGLGTHGLYPSRDAKFLYVANRGSHMVHGPRHSKGSVSVVDFATDKMVKNWAIPGGGSPDMGNVSPDGKTLWLSGRFDDVVYAINTDTGSVKQIPVGAEPHGLTVWPQPGRYSIGHTGIMR